MFLRGPCRACVPDSWEGYFRLGNFYYTVQRFQEAEVQYRRALELAPDNAGAYIFNLGTVLTNENRCTLKARAVLEKGGCAESHLFGLQQLGQRVLLGELNIRMQQLPMKKRCC